ncbi:MAG: hypothetical protein WB809_00785 [Thermoplasmata archaeon]
MSEANKSPARDDRLPNGGRPTGPCELRRALIDIEGPNAPLVPGPCSGDAPEQRSFPAAPPGESAYFLCNAHLRDVFTALDRVRSQRLTH